MAYSYLTYLQFRQQLAERLDDVSNIYWTDTELKAYSVEALRTWQSLARYSRSRMTFSTSSGVPYYDLTTQSGTLVPFTVTVNSLNSILAYHLIEAQPSGATWLGTDQFSMADFLSALQCRRDQFLVETGMVLTQSSVPGPTPPNGILGLTDSVIDIRQAYWKDTLTGGYSVVWKSDEWHRQAFAPSWNTQPGIPSSRSVIAQPPVTIQLMPPPANPGSLLLFTVNAGAVLNPSSSTLIGIPDDFTWVVKWGALADLLARDGQASDPERAQYCQSRWTQGILAARAYTSVVDCYINGVPVFVSSVFDLDTMQPGWLNGTPAQPTIAALGGWNMLLVSPPPSSGPFSIMLDILQNAPLPSSDTAYIQVGREELDAVLGYAQHLAAFKHGGQEFTITIPLYQQFLQMAMLRNERLAAAMRSIQPMFDRSQREDRQRPRRATEIPVGVGPDTPQ